eukprot:7219802-Alexandrium_andersonii.AAC.1
MAELRLLKVRKSWEIEQHQQAEQAADALIRPFKAVIREGNAGKGYSLNLQEWMDFLTDAAKPMVHELARNMQGWMR